MEPERFAEMETAGEFVESSRVYDFQYGGRAQDVLDAVESGTNILWKVDPEGAGKIKSRFPEAVVICIIPPSPEEQRARILGRATESDGEVKRRLAAAEAEYQTLPKWDYVVVNPNDKVDVTVRGIRSLIRSILNPDVGGVQQPAA